MFRNLGAASHSQPGSFLSVRLRSVHNKHERSFRSFEENYVRASLSCQFRVEVLIN